MGVATRKNSFRNTERNFKYIFTCFGKEARFCRNGYDQVKEIICNGVHLHIDTDETQPNEQRPGSARTKRRKDDFKLFGVKITSETIAALSVVGIICLWIVALALRLIYFIITQKIKEHQRRKRSKGKRPSLLLVNDNELKVEINPAEA